MSALPLAWNGNLPTLMAMSSRWHSCSVRPIEAICADRGQALVRSDVRQLQAADDVADRVQVRLGGAHPAVDLDEAALDLGPGRLDPDAVRVRRAARGDDHLLGAQLLGLLALATDHHAHAAVVDADRGRVEAGIRDDLDAAAGERALELLAHVGVLERRDRRRVFEHGDVDPGIAEERGELDADGAGADDDDAARQRVAGGYLVAGHDALAVRLEPGQRLDARAGGNNDVGRVERALAVGLAVVVERLDVDLLAALERRPPANVLDLVLLDQAHQPLGQAVDDLVPALGHDGVVERRLAGQIDAVVTRALDALVQLGRLEHRLGRDAAPEQARPADARLLIDERHAQTELAGTEGGRVAAGATADDDEVEAVRGADGHLARASGGRAAHGSHDDTMGWGHRWRW
jgi:hypothetical protein